MRPIIGRISLLEGKQECLSSKVRQSQFWTPIDIQADRGGARQQAGADRLCARDQKRPLRRPSGRGLNQQAQPRTRFRRKAIRIEGDGEAM